MSNEAKVARPATPNLDLLETLTDQVYLPAGHAKLASAGQIAGTVDELSKALAIGAQVSTAVTRKEAARRQMSPLDAHAQKVAALLGQGPTAEEQALAEAQAINDSIAQDPALAQKFAAALQPAAPAAAAA